MREIENGERKTGIWYVIDFTDTFNGRILKYILDGSWELFLFMTILSWHMFHILIVERNFESSLLTAHLKLTFNEEQIFLLGD